MAYNNLCSAQGFNCTRLLYWSNPGVSYLGTPMGIAGGTKSDCPTGNTSNVSCDADNHAVLNSTALTVANFRPAVGAMPTFTDNPLVAGSTQVKAVHITELRTAIDSLRARYGLGGATWTDGTLTSGVTTVKGVHVSELRTALAAVYVAAGVTPPTYTNPTITAGVTVITTVHIAELRAAVLAIW